MALAPRRLAAFLLCLAALLGPTFVPTIPAAQAPAASDWKKEFEEVCAKTQDAMLLSQDELRELVRRCDALKPRLEALGESERKVYLKRLSACRNLYAYVLESR